MVAQDADGKASGCQWFGCSETFCKLVQGRQMLFHFFGLALITWPVANQHVLTTSHAALAVRLSIICSMS